MPIYAYKCDACGFANDVLQKMSDAQLVVCPACNESTFKKQVTAAGFQLKGSGWYATDFKGSGAAPTPGATPAAGAAPSSGETSAPVSTTDAASSKSAAAPAVAPSPAPVASGA